MSKLKRITNKNNFIVPSPFPVIPNGNIPTSGFLESLKKFIDFIGLLGTMFRPVIYDINKNMLTIKKKYQLDPKNSQTLSEMLENGVRNNEISLIESIVWINREMNFVQRFLELVILNYKTQKRLDNINHYLEKAYDECLRPFQTLTFTNLMKFLFRSCPKKKKFIAMLSNNRPQSERIMFHALQIYNDSLKIVLGSIELLITQQGILNMDF